MSFSGLTQKRKSEIPISNLFWTIIDWLYPPACFNCKNNGAVFCSDCFSQIKIIDNPICKKCGIPLKRNGKYCTKCIEQPPIYEEMRSFGNFEGVLRQAVHSLKYENNISLGPILARPLAEIVERNHWEVDLVVPVPLSKQRFRSRGYNQADCIANPLANLLDIPYSKKGLNRIRNTKTQISLNINERFMNLNDAFLGFPDRLKDKKVLIIDDVITTGATMQGCVRAAIDAGAKRVYCLSVARVVLQYENK